jgi:hypothetical protein
MAKTGSGARKGGKNYVAPKSPDECVDTLLKHLFGICPEICALMWQKVSR